MNQVWKTVWKRFGRLTAFQTSACGGGMQSGLENAILYSVSEPLLLCTTATANKNFSLAYDESPK
jgi:hypothetical protein